jgi:hypothetical protein
MDQQAASEEKRKFLSQGENLRQVFIPNKDKMDEIQGAETAEVLSRKRPHLALKAVAAALLALIVLLGSSLTVYAANNSLPGQPLYALKSWGEDVRLSLTSSPQTRLEITLNYTNRRIDEISRLLQEGKSLPGKVSDRYQGELENALQYAAQMEDEQMQQALSVIKSHAENQGTAMEELIKKFPDHAELVMIHLQERLHEQLRISAMGESDPDTFRVQIRERQQSQGRNHKSGSDDASSSAASSSSTPLPAGGENHEDETDQTTPEPGNEDKNQGQGNKNQGNGGHGAEPSRTPRP